MSTQKLSGKCIGMSHLCMADTLPIYESLNAWTLYTYFRDGMHGISGTPEEEQELQQFKSIFFRPLQEY